MKSCWDGPSPQTVRQSWKQPLLYLSLPIWSSVSHLLDYTKQKGVPTQIRAQKLTNGVTLGGRGSQRSIKKSKPHTSSLDDQEGLSLTLFCQLSPPRSPTGPGPWQAWHSSTAAYIHALTVEKPLSGCFPHYLQVLTHFFLGLSKEGSRTYSLSPHQTAFKSTAPFRGNCY